jgi:dTDP-4-amino-4,6-dideoxygalactose transaminase
MAFIERNMGRAVGAMSGLISLSRPSLGAAEMREVRRVLRSGQLTQGQQVSNFEQEFSTNLVEGSPCVAVNSGTAALHLGLLAAGIEKGDEVIVPSFTFAATPNAIVLAGGVPVFCDIDIRTLNIDASKIEALIGPKTKAIMVVHLYGNPAGMGAIMKIAKKYSLIVIEDAAQAHGAESLGKKVGAFGTAAAFSFYPTKNMTSGEGGMISFRDYKNSRVARLLRNQGMETRYQNEIVGFNARLSEIHAAIGRVQLRRLGKWTVMRQTNANRLNQLIDSLETQVVDASSISVYHQFAIRVPEDRDRFQRALLEEWKVESGVYYPVPCHQLKPFRNFQPRLAMGETEKASQQVLCIPVAPHVSHSQIDRVARAVNRLASAGA